jgi:hypothetical protein
MTCVQTNVSLDGVPIVRLESDCLRVDVAPGVGGRIISLIDKVSGHEFLWRNRALALQLQSPGSEYDPNFFGGIDELLPNDMPEVIDDVTCPDHGELWTTALAFKMEGNQLALSGTLARFGLHYERRMTLGGDTPCIDFDYRITNIVRQPRHFLWKLHAALNVAPGDLVECPARKGQVVDLAWSRYHSLTPFDWPHIEGQDAHRIPSADGTVDFFYLFDLAEGRIGWSRPSDNLKFTYEFDRKVFPYAWLFASYGGFDGHYTVILEPCTTMPLSVNEAKARGQCSMIEPGQTLETRVSIRGERAKQNSPASL